MSVRYDDLPFPRGTTQTDGMDEFAGKEYLVEDVDLSSSYNPGRTKRTKRFVRLRLVKNTAAIALRPMRSVSFKAATLKAEVDGYTTTTAANWAGIVDEWLPAAGVPVNDYFYIAVGGPTRVLTDIASGANNVWTEDSTILVALTAATSGATTAGRVYPQDLTGSSSITDYSTIANQVQNRIGIALSASTTAETNSGKLVDLFARWS